MARNSPTELYMAARVFVLRHPRLVPMRAPIRTRKGHGNGNGHGHPPLTLHDKLEVLKQRNPNSYARVEEYVDCLLGDLATLEDAGDALDSRDACRVTLEQLQATLASIRAVRLPRSR